MPTQEEGIVNLDVKKEWKHEALHFTPWLAKNLDKLGKAIGVELECDQTEVQVGPFACDILATDVDSGAKVAIENQLELSDHGHLGQLLTYAAGLGARIAVWVTPAFCYEHAEALHRLNQWTHDGVRFYAVRVTLRKAGDALPEPHLESVVTPSHWNKTLTQQKGEMSPLKQQYHHFFQPLIAELNGAGFAGKATNHYDNSGRFIRSLLDPGIGYAATLEENKYAWVGLHIQTNDTKLTKQIFDNLEHDKEAIEASIDLGSGQEWCWHRTPFTYSSINIRRAGTIHDPSKKLKETTTWMRYMLPKLKQVFEPRLENILKEVQDTVSG